MDKSHRPHHHPNEHTPEEKDMILRRYPRYKDDMIMLWDSLRKSGYTRSCTSLVRVMNKWIKPEMKKKPKPYQRAEYPGQKLQLNVKFVPNYCVSTGQNIINIRRLTSVHAGHIGNYMMNIAHIARLNF